MKIRTSIFCVMLCLMLVLGACSRGNERKEEPVQSAEDTEQAENTGKEEPEQNMQQAEKALLSGLTQTEQDIFLSLLKKVRDTL